VQTDDIKALARVLEFFTRSQVIASDAALFDDDFREKVGNAIDELGALVSALQQHIPRDKVMDIVWIVTDRMAVITRDAAQIRLSLQ